MTERGDLWRRGLAEWLGTFFLVLIGPGAVMVNAYSGGGLGTTGIALAFAFVIAAMIFSVGHISGAHLNPAVTIGLWSAGRFPASDVVMYVGAQCVGASAAAFTLKGLLGAVGQQGATIPAIGVERSFVLELLLSFVLMLVIMGVGTDRRARPGSAPVAIGLTVGFCALTGPLTGASMNPARSLGPALAGGGWAGHWLYWLAPLGGMIIAARVYDFMRTASPPSSSLVQER